MAADRDDIGPLPEITNPYPAIGEAGEQTLKEVEKIFVHALDLTRLALRDGPTGRCAPGLVPALRDAANHYLKRLGYDLTVG